MSSEFTPKKAQKAAVKLKMAIQGPSGSGKTEGALALAKNFMPNAKILLIDTENSSASLYADRYDFDTIPLTAPYTSQRYVNAMREAVTGGYDVLIVDSITQQWDGEGGILRRKEEKDRSGGNSFTNWASFTPEHTRFMEFIKQLPVHTIVTMRSKQAYILEKNDKGKEAPRKVGLDPIQREGTEYEYTIVFEVNMAHRATTSKNRTTLFQTDELIDLTSPKVAEELKAWLANGILLPRPAEDVVGQVVDEVERQQAVHAPATIAEAVLANVKPKEEGYVPPELEWSYQKTTGILICRITDVQKKTKKGSKDEFLAVKINQPIEGKWIIFYWHKTHIDLLLASIGKIVKLETDVKGGFANINAVLEIDGEKVEESTEDFEMQARWLAGVLEFTEPELTELHQRWNRGSWKDTLAALQGEKLRRESLEGEPA
jgi:hypothetical protein